MTKYISLLLLAMSVTLNCFQYREHYKRRPTDTYGCGTTDALWGTPGINKEFCVNAVLDAYDGAFQ